MSGGAAAFTAATEAKDKPAAQALPDFMRFYVRRREIEAELENENLWKHYQT